MNLSRREWMAMTGLAAANGLAQPQTHRTEMREIAEANKFTVARQTEGAPNRLGWYHLTTGVAATGEGLVCVYRRTDAHTAITSDIMVCYSQDGGRTWDGHKSISHADAWNDGGHWVAPQLSRLRDGRLAVVCDFGHRTAHDDHPMLAQWQKPGRGMWNHIFWSSDNGKTWDGPHRIDDMGGEPGYIVELADGTLVFTRTESRETGAVWNPPLPWGPNYYRGVAVFSDDRGKTWSRTSVISDDPLQGDCEVGLVELAPRELLAVTRVGFGNGQFGQPSRFVYSHDSGKTWGDAALTPIYGQRTIVRKLASGKLLVTYRSWWGTTGTYALVWDPAEKLPYQPSSFIWDESRCTLARDAMKIETGDGGAKGVIFALYPAQAPESRVEIEAELRVMQADVNGCSISAGCYVRFEPNRISLEGRPEDGFAIDAREWRRYRIVREKGSILIFADGELKLKRPVAGLETRHVRFGNREAAGWVRPLNDPHGLIRTLQEPPKPVGNASHTEWRSVRAKVENRKDHSIDWTWSARDGFPDQFRRNRMVRVDRNGSLSPGNSGYSGWTETKDGRIVIVDYTMGNPPAPMTFVRAYLTSEKELL